jgi:hypothetical protein
MARNGRGTVVPKIVLPPGVVARLDRLAASQGLRGRVVLASRAALAGFEMMLAHPPKKYTQPGGVARQQEDAGVKVELRPADLARIERHAADVGAARNVIVAMAVVRGLRALGAAS